MRAQRVFQVTTIARLRPTNHQKDELRSVGQRIGRAGQFEQPFLTYEPGYADDDDVLGRDAERASRRFTYPIVGRESRGIDAVADHTYIAADAETLRSRGIRVGLAE